MLVLITILIGADGGSLAVTGRLLGGEQLILTIRTSIGILIIRSSLCNKRSMIGIMIRLSGICIITFIVDISPLGMSYGP